MNRTQLLERLKTLEFDKCELNDNILPGLPGWSE